MNHPGYVYFLDSHTDSNLDCIVCNKLRHNMPQFVTLIWIYLSLPFLHSMVQHGVEVLLECFHNNLLLFTA